MRLSVLLRKSSRQFRHYMRASQLEADEALRAGEFSCQIPEAMISKIDVAHLPANSPTQDFVGIATILPTDSYLFGVFDGHGGNMCSHYVCTKLFDYIGVAQSKKHTIEDFRLEKRLKWIFSNATVDAENDVFRESHLRHLHDFNEKIKANSYQTSIRNGLEDAFKICDHDIMREAMNNGNSSPFLNAVSCGSCGLVAHLRNGRLHVANTGDSAAVLGMYKHGKIMSLPLTNAHCVENPDEVKRIQSEHPSSESTTVLAGGRLLGELSPLRAFGDARFKWPHEVQRNLLYSDDRFVSRLLQTPPYLTAAPEVFHHRLTADDRFMVIATDGLWEWLDCDAVVKLVHDHELGAQTLTHYNPYKGTTLDQVAMDLKQRVIGSNKKPLDENSATHLLRHALGGCNGGIFSQYRRLIELLQLPKNVVRNYRDDITIIVVHFDYSNVQSISTQ